jgi:hypothetical protein
MHWKNWNKQVVLLKLQTICTNKCGYQYTPKFWHGVILTNCGHSKCTNWGENSFIGCICEVGVCDERGVCNVSIYKLATMMFVIVTFNGLEIL